MSESERTSFQRIVLGTQREDNDQFFANILSKTTSIEPISPITAVSSPCGSISTEEPTIDSPINEMPSTDTFAGQILSSASNEMNLNTIGHRILHAIGQMQVQLNGIEKKIDKYITNAHKSENRDESTLESFGLPLKSVQEVNDFENRLNIKTYRKAVVSILIFSFSIFVYNCFVLVALSQAVKAF